VNWQPEPDQSRPEGSGGNDGPVAPDSPLPATRPAGKLRRRLRQFAFGLVLMAGLAGLAASAVGIAHQLLPRRFTTAQRRAITAWEMERRWRALPAGTIFPAAVPYALQADRLFATSSLVLNARRLGISRATRCTSAASGAAVRLLNDHGCAAALRATYADSSDSLVATITVAVMPSTSAARTVVSDMPGPGAGQMVVRSLRIADTPAAKFGDADRQLSRTASVGPYVILATAGFTDARHHMPITDNYLDAEMLSLLNGLMHKASRTLGGPPPVPSCPGAPGC
jgi:hypothetical protein